VSISEARRGHDVTLTIDQSSSHPSAALLEWWARQTTLVEGRNDWHQSARERNCKAKITVNALALGFVETDSICIE
jgi:hypothetical protein